nr:11536_t:CDS:2 [Entrophospora candida]
MCSIFKGTEGRQTPLSPARTNPAGYLVVVNISRCVLRPEHILALEPSCYLCIAHLKYLTSKVASAFEDLCSPTEMKALIIDAETWPDDANANLRCLKRDESITDEFVVKITNIFWFGSKVTTDMIVMTIWQCANLPTIKAKGKSAFKDQLIADLDIINSGITLLQNVATQHYERDTISLTNTPLTTSEGTATISSSSLEARARSPSSSLFLIEGTVRISSSPPFEVSYHQ